MGSGIFFPICALPFSILLIILFFKKGYVKNVETKLYKILIISNLVGLVLEILCTFGSLIYSEMQYISNFIYKSYLSYLLIWTGLFTYYIYKISIIKECKINKYINMTLPLLSSIILIITYILPFFGFGM